ncbi:MAG: hypothetical protein QOD07_1358 [Frankiaceae bacterium]|jgi:uncharacterized protein with NRDE domain|nr:hypothetical protein [Frankiaceae bacterium]
MCTVVVRWQAGQPAQILALRDESTARAFDDPGRWWPEFPDLVGGRDRGAGGTWCANNVATGVTAMVLNRAPKRVADAGAPSRGVLPLLAARHEDGWTAHLDVTGMASFALVLATPMRLTTWEYDGARLTSTELSAGTHMVTSGGAEDGKTERYLDRFAAAEFPGGWRAMVEAETPRDDPAGLVIRHEAESFVYATVFGQLIDAEPGRLRVDYSRTPWLGGSWSRREE